MDKVKKRGEVISADQRLSISTRYKKSNTSYQFRILE